jgi:hypothetical protein
VSLECCLEPCGDYLWTRRKVYACLLVSEGMMYVHVNRLNVEKA